MGTATKTRPAMADTQTPRHSAISGVPTRKKPGNLDSNSRIRSSAPGPTKDARPLAARLAKILVEKGLVK